ncbi:MAG TPA: hypothetical protein VMH28_08880 [Candidatus Acidoferrales bacterium]|nr:hypothetical protein [Candidatus Acidoferrales bacterium]
MRSDLPHHTTIGWREPMQIRTAVFNGSGQPSIGPTGVADQSNERIRLPISPISGKKFGWAR